uniref:NADH dehydrogenase subunit 6 n=1 Tax=Thrips hawaiiensis TaxID=163894 RepID=A0A8A0XX50_9NEOP|nr:NADH dehydrogenase subunit 6 [Thrips hawaiiensis]QSQ87292.1 NADH dehydrogenase subunit 6 [Thrips hawaiiensis]
MLTLLFSTLLTSSYMMIFTNHPLILAMLVLFQAMMTSIILGMISSFMYFSYFFYIVYLGGILMLFFYIIGLIKHKETLSDSKLKWETIFFVFIGFISMMEMNLIEDEYEISMSMFMEMIMSIFSTSSMKPAIYFMFFLLFIMVIVVYLSDTSKGSMRKI